MQRFGGHSDQAIPDDMFAEGDSQETIDAVIQTIQRLGHKVVGIEADNRVVQRLKAEKPQIVFNIAEGLFGDFRESYIPMTCERLGIPYTGSDPLTLGICLNKSRTKEILSHYAIPNAPFRLIYPHEDIQARLEDFPFPAIVKPLSEGSSKGIFNDSVLFAPESAAEIIQKMFAKYQQPLVIEKFLDGKELTVAVWGNGDEVEVLPIVEICFDALPSGAVPIYSYEAKWIWDRPEKPLNLFVCPASLSLTAEKRVEAVVREAWQVLGIKDWCRIDVRFDGEIPNILEVNPLPGILPKHEDNSCFPKAARTAGYSYGAMLEKIIDIAVKRWGMKDAVRVPEAALADCI
ncbi:MAG TPA: D-alanine--D-alanine ligase [bacterium]|nr:D-alanine--D-alanine ligase [bacterium]